MVTAVHALVYSDDPAATRAFFRDVLRWPWVASEPGSDWLIFGTGPSELGVHPTSTEWAGKTYSSFRHHSISLMCEDLPQTMAELASRGATFAGEVAEHGFGSCAMLEVPGADPVMLYQPRHAVAFALAPSPG